MKRNPGCVSVIITRRLLLLCSVTALHAAQFPDPANTNTVNNGTGAPPLTAEESLARMKSVPPGFKGSVFASEPHVQNPVQMTWDSRGRLWVAENYTYESDSFVETYSDRIVIFEGADGGAKFTSRKVFVDDLKRLLGFAIGHGGVWVMAVPNILFIPDRNSDGVPDGPAEIVFDGFNAVGSNMHTNANGLRFGVDGWIYGRTGHAHLHMVGPPGTPLAQRARVHGSLFRFHPRTRVFESLSSGAVNTFGQDWDKHGEHFFSSTVVGPYWYEMPGAKFRSSSVEPNQKAYELIDQIGNFDFGGVGGGRSGARGGAAAGTSSPTIGIPTQGAVPVPRIASGAAPTPSPDAGARRPWASGPWINGHAITGLMIYQGDNWPAEYRDRMYALNLFGHRVVAQTLERSDSGYVAKRAPEPDLFEFPDPWFRGIDITYGPDGGVFICDWTDTGDYHNRTGSNRLSGRIFKITHGDAKPSSGSDLHAMTVEQLVALNSHANEWFPRHARLEFSHRMVDGRGIGNARQLLLDQFNRETEVVLKLRSLLTLYVINAADESLLLPLLRSPEEHLRVWAVRLLVQHWPLDALHTNDVIPPGTDGWRDGGGRGVRYIQQRPARVVGGPEVSPSAGVMAEFSRMAARDSSSLVRLVLASTMQRMPFDLRPGVAAGLLAHKEDATDKNLPLMVWYALIPLAEKTPAALAALGSKSELRATRKYIARRLAEDIKTNPRPLDELIAAATRRDEAYQTDFVDGFTQGLEGQRELALPAGWEDFSAKIGPAANAALVAKVRNLDVLLGSPRAMAEARRVVFDSAATPEARKTALQSLLNARAPELRQVAEQALEIKSVNAVAATALAMFNEPAIAPMLVAAYPKFNDKDRPQLIAALASRAAFASHLLDAIAAGTIPRADISASDARQIRSLNDAALTKRLGEIWGEIRETPAAKLELLAKYKAELSPRAGRGGPVGGRGPTATRGGNAFSSAANIPAGLTFADRSAGRVVFANTCAACHTLFGEGGKIGPDLTGGQKRRDLDTLLAKMVDPSSELPVESRLTIVKLKDDRTVGGIITNRTSNTITLGAIGEPTTVALSEVVSTELAPYSLMPDGLLESLDATQRRNLVAYLMGDDQVPLAAASTP
jgi:putative membrane-bound dehydrogenase-like protein